MSSDRPALWSLVFFCVLLASASASASTSEVCVSPNPDGDSAGTEWCMENTSQSGGSHTVTATVGSGQGSIDPSSQIVANGDSAEFSVIANPDWSVGSITGDTCSPADNGNGNWSAPNITEDCAVEAHFVVAGTVTNIFCANPSVAIPDNNPAGIDVPLNVDVSGEITATRIQLQGTHTWVGDLRFTLTHPDGSPAVTLIDRPGVPATDFGCANEDFDLWLSDNGTDGPVNDMCSAPPALRDNPTPEQPLSAFSGLDTVGDWTLNVSDNADGDIGTLQSVCIELSYQPVDGDTWTVTPSAGAGGTIAPDSPQPVADGATTVFEFRPEVGFSIAGAGGTCGGALVDDIFTTNPVFNNCTVIASFSVSEYLVSAAVGEGQGTITPANQTIIHGQNATFTVTPGGGWMIEEVRGDTCTPLESGASQWTAADITEPCAVTVDFELLTYTVTPTTFGGGGSIQPSTPQVVVPGGQIVFILEPSEEQMVDEVTGTCGGILDGLTYTTDPVITDCSVEARFTGAIYTVTAATGSGQGSITPGSQSVGHGNAASFTVNAEAGWSVGDVTGTTCTPVQNGGLWQAANISADCHVTATFSQSTFTVTPSAGSGGSISPDTPQTVAEGSTAAFNIQPESGYRILDVTGSCGGERTGNVYTTNPVNDDCTVHVSFELNQDILYQDRFQSPPNN